MPALLSLSNDLWGTGHLGWTSIADPVVAGISLIPIAPIQVIGGIYGLGRTYYDLTHLEPEKPKASVPAEPRK